MQILAACHLHSAWSYDGSWTLEALRDRFSNRGCKVLMMTEHDRGFSPSRLNDFRAACAEASIAETLILPGIEYSDAANHIHVLVWGNVPFLGEGLPTGEMLEAVSAANGVAVLAHPSRREAWKYFKPEWRESLLGIEVWNRKYDGWAPSNTAAMILAGSTVPFVGLDFHTTRQSFPLAMALDVQGPLREACVLDALRSQRCEARAFGIAFGRKLFREALPVLNIAELSRRTAISIAKRSRLVSR